MELKKLNHRHDQIVEWLVVNGDKTLTECAKEFGYTLPWVSQMVNSDMFQVEYKLLCAERKVAAVHTVSAKMTNAVSLALDRYVEKMQPGKDVSEKFLVESTGQLLDRLGYTSAPPREAPQEHLHLHLTADDIEAGRNKARLLNASE